METATTLGATVWHVLAYPLCMAVGSALGAGIAFGGYRLLHWLKRRA